MYSARNKREYTLITFLDVMKAFDVVHHGRLLMKLKVLGLGYSALKLVVSYLDSRRSCALANGVRSDYLDVVYGVPQGRVLGPILFVLYVNDLPKCVKNCQLVLYADDLGMLSRGKDPYRVQSLMQSDLNSVSAWL